MLNQFPVELLYAILEELPLHTLAKAARINRRLLAVTTGQRSPVRERLRNRPKLHIGLYTPTHKLQPPRFPHRIIHRPRWLEAYSLRVFKQLDNNDGLSANSYSDNHVAYLSICVRCCESDEFHPSVQTDTPGGGVTPNTVLLMLEEERQVTFPTAYFNSRTDAYIYVKNFLLDINKRSIIARLYLGSYVSNRYDWIAKTIGELDIAKRAHIGFTFKNSTDCEAMFFESTDQEHVKSTNEITEEIPSFTYRPLNSVISQFKDLSLYLVNCEFDGQFTACFSQILTGIFAMDLDIEKWDLVIIGRGHFAYVDFQNDVPENYLPLLLAGMPANAIRIFEPELNERRAERDYSLKQSAKIRKSSTKQLIVNLHIITHHQPSTLEFRVLLRTEK